MPSGVARLPGDEEETGQLIGTPAYMAPEQTRGDGVGPKADLFALGSVLYEMLTATAPFRGDTLMDTLAAVAEARYRPVREAAPGVPRAAAALLDRLLAKDAADRPASAEDVSGELSRLRDAGPPGPGDAVESTRPPRRVGSPRVVADSDSDFELTLDDTSNIPDRPTAAAGERDIFETDFELPAVADDTGSGSEVVAVEGSTDDLETSDFDLMLTAPRRGSSAVVALDDSNDTPTAEAQQLGRTTRRPTGDVLAFPPARRAPRTWLNPLTWFRRVADPVDVTAFAPPTVAAGNAVMVQLFAHVPEKTAEANKLATLFDSFAGPRGVTSLELDVRRGTPLTVHLAAGPLAVDQSWQRLVWRGKTAAVQFAVSAADTLPPQTVVATAQVFQDTIPIGTVRFKLDVTATINPARPVVTGRGTRYRRAFVSYATPDRAEVLKRVQALRAVRVEVFQDILALEPGERWERKLYERIDACDLFLLFWSAAATRSEWVRKELRYAVGRKNGSDESPPDIVPVVLDGPPPPDPPSELRHLHFDDYLAHLIRGAG